MSYQLLNSISSSTDLDTIAFFELVVDYSPEFVEKLNLLLTWSVTPLQYGDHRPFASVTLLRGWCDKALKRASRRDCPPPDEFMQDRLFDWLDLSDVTGEPKNIRAVALLLDNLIQNEVFSYNNYVQRLIARGEPGLSFNEVR
jgi:mediator of RNA polymerase II transcription subunit 12